MENHLTKFEGKSSILLSQDSYEAFMEGKSMIGYAPTSNDPNGSMFVSTSADIDNALENCNGDISILESSLGFPEGYFGDGPVVRVDINNPEEHGLRMANGKESGANEFFNTKLDENGNLPDIKYTDENRRIVDVDKTSSEELHKLNGQYTNNHGIYHEPNTTGYDGKTSGGLSEAVIDQVPNNSENISYSKIDGFKRGESSDLQTSHINDGYSLENESKISNRINENNNSFEQEGLDDDYYYMMGM